MPGPAHQLRRVLTTRGERKELLVLACEVDRASWRQACRPAARAGLAGELLGGLEALLALLPGRLGRWLRAAGFLARLGRQFGGRRR